MNWIHKYAPKTLKEVVGQDQGIKKLLSYVLNFDKYRGKAALIYGPPGVGKTCSVYALANDYNYEIVELNASDFRSKSEIKEVIGNAINQSSLFFKKKLILIDEVDGISGMEDYGGLSEILNIIDKSRFPIVITANDPFDSKFSSLRNRSILIEYKHLNYLSVLKRLRQICEKEKIDYDEDALRSIARMSSGDLRSAINDLMLVSLGTKKVTKESLSILAQRDRIESIFQALVKIFKTNELNIAIHAFDDVDEDPENLIFWVEENMLKEYNKIEEIEKAFYYLSKGDIFRNRIRRWQYWRFLVYYLQMITGGVALSKKEKYRKFVAYSRPRRILQMWILSNRYKMRNEAARKIAKRLHTSYNNVLKTLIPYLKFYFKFKGFKKLLKEGYGLNEKEIEAIEGVKNEY